ncbi:hypothetical protein [Cryptosporangium aurantiacum]|uniref:Uncharacterized protein n=1 Tax=Cryptosporangium aurantiacum TaxID=134849 RepID=A0A1M7RMP0_9ACTN|nr:hypothetical protein [Cryptosporangium aurantiacum]SHN47597.1 hypothetical protein SAMN05443668_12557 [Cryptosporangium aurantiacum]
MTLTEKRAWITLVVTVVAYTVYVIVITARVDGRSLPDVPYAGPLLTTIVGAMVAAIVIEIVLSAVTPNASRVQDVRDKEIHRLGEYVGQSFVTIGAVSAMLMAVVEWDPFWIANVIYLCFVLAAVLGAVAKVIVYRRTMPEW